MITMLIKVFLFGIDRAGKTAIVNYLKAGTPKNAKPTLAFNILSLDFGDFELQVWDAPGQQNLRRLWNNGYNQAKFMIYVLDVSDSGRFIETQNEFIKVINDNETKNLPLIFLYNKMDLQKAQDNLELAKLTFEKLLEEKKVSYILETSIKQEKTMQKLKETIIQLVKDNKLAKS
jgi:small GTP-binding protein